MDEEEASADAAQVIGVNTESVFGSRPPMEADIERQWFIAAIHEAEVAIEEGRTQPAEEVYADMKAKYGF